MRHAFYVDLSTVKDISIVIAGVATLAGFMAAVSEYVRQNQGRRAEHFVVLRRRFLETPSFQGILSALSDDMPQLAEIPVQERRNFLGFLEEVQLMVDSRLIRAEVAHIMFGRYVRLADRSQHLWHGLERTDHYWAIFRRLAKSQEELESTVNAAEPLRF